VRRVYHHVLLVISGPCRKTINAMKYTVVHAEPFFDDEKSNMQRPLGLPATVMKNRTGCIRHQE
tara:strand:+ start:198 stop:389 length:192 start_codon:yes stop_codon:yes gene_type:complete